MLTLQCMCVAAVIRNRLYLLDVKHRTLDHVRGSISKFRALCSCTHKANRSVFVIDRCERLQLDLDDSHAPLILAMHDSLKSLVADTSVLCTLPYVGMLHLFKIMLNLRLSSMLERDALDHVNAMVMFSARDEFLEAWLDFLDNNTNIRASDDIPVGATFRSVRLVISMLGLATIFNDMVPVASLRLLAERCGGVGKLADLMTAVLAISNHNFPHGGLLPVAVYYNAVEISKWLIESQCGISVTPDVAIMGCMSMIDSQLYAICKKSQVVEAAIDKCIDLKSMCYVSQMLKWLTVNGDLESLTYFDKVCRDLAAIPSMTFLCLISFCVYWPPLFDGRDVFCRISSVDVLHHLCELMGGQDELVRIVWLSEQHNGVVKVNLAWRNILQTNRAQVKIRDKHRKEAMRVADDRKWTLVRKFIESMLEEQH